MAEGMFVSTVLLPVHAHVSELNLKLFHWKSYKMLSIVIDEVSILIVAAWGPRLRGVTVLYP